MAEYVEQGIGVGPQTVNAGSNVVLTDSIPCNKGLVIHRNDSGILTLRGITNNCSGFARYLVEYHGNIAVPTTGTAGEISLAMAISGEIVPATLARVTPAAVGDYFSVSSARYVTVPAGCCYNIAIENSSDQTILVDNLNVIVTRVA